MITFRQIKDSDILFIEKVYRSTREKELSFTNWSEEQKNTFIIMQSMAQEAEYKKSYPGAHFEIILYKKQPAGRLYTWETNIEIRLIDISLLPAFRGKGIGTTIIKSLIKRSEQKQIPVTLHVDPDNPALQLYLRFGFKHVKNNGRNMFMERTP